MNHRKDLFRRKALFLAVASVFVLPAAAYAQANPPSAEIEVGVGHVSRDSFKFGEYTGLEDKGAYLIGNFELSGSDPETSKYWSFTGTSLGLRSRNLRYRFNDQGNYGITLEYDEIPKFRSETTQTIFNGVGSNTLTLPAGWVPSAVTTSTTTPAVAAQINANLRAYDDKTQRENYKLGFSKVLSRQWDASVNFRHEKKDGVKVIGATLGSSGGNPKAVLIPEPVDYETNILEARVNYATSRMQFQLGYNMSLFSNQNDFLRWESPLTNTGWATASMGAPPFPGQIGLPPDNQFHQILATAGYNLSPTARLNGTLQYGRMTQDQAFLPYTINPGLAATITNPLPRASLDGRIDNTLLNVVFTARPLPRFDVAASYRFDDRDNKTPQAFYNHIPGDSQLQAATLADNLWRQNLPISYQQNQLKLDGKYALANRLKLNAGYAYEEVKRTFAEANKTEEHTYRVGLRRGFSEAINGSVSYAFSERKNKGYDGTVPFYADHTPEEIASLAAGVAFENHPFLRKFTYADRDRDKIRFSINAAPHDMVNLQFRADLNRDNYKNTRFGLTDSETQSYTLDASVTPKQNLTYYAFYTYESADNDTAGRSFNSGNKLALSTPLTSTADWYNTARDRFDVIGLGFKLADLGRLDLGGDYTYSYGVGKIDTIVGSALTAAPMPDLVSRLNRLQLYAKYQVQKNMAVRVSYWYQKLKTSDWTVDNVTPTTVGNVLTTGQLSPNYTVNVVGVSLILKY